MNELISEALTLVNLPFTALFGFVVVYWALVVLGAGGDAVDGVWRGIAGLAANA